MTARSGKTRKCLRCGSESIRLEGEEKAFLCAACSELFPRERYEGELKRVRRGTEPHLLGGRCYQEHDVEEDDYSEDSMP